MKSETPTRLYGTQDDLLEALCAYRDHALAWVGQLTVERQSKGIGAAMTAFDRLQERVERLQDRMSTEETAGGMMFYVPPWSLRVHKGSDDGTDTDAQGSPADPA